MADLCGFGEKTNARYRIIFTLQRVILRVRLSLNLWPFPVKEVYVNTTVYHTSPSTVLPPRPLSTAVVVPTFQPSAPHACM